MNVLDKEMVLKSQNVIVHSMLNIKYACEFDPLNPILAVVQVFRKTMHH
jgi:hypothetical protein